MPSRDRWSPRVPAVSRSCGRRFPQTLLEAGPVGGHTSPLVKKHVVQAETFEVVDEQGRVRVRIGVSGGDEPFVSLHDDAGRVRARFALGADGSAGLAI